MLKLASFALLDERSLSQVYCEPAIENPKRQNVFVSLPDWKGSGHNAQFGEELGGGEERSSHHIQNEKKLVPVDQHLMISNITIHDFTLLIL